MRKFLRILGLAVGVPLLVGLVYQPLATAIESRRFPAPGRMIAVNGHRLHIRCQGSGYPTVVLEAELGGSSLDWSLVAPRLARQTRVCAYDRAGYGWSDSGPLPRTSAAVADELHTLLIRAEEPGPYILAAHGLGGLHARLFAHRYPQETAGLVLVDPADGESPPLELHQAVTALAATGLHRALAAAQVLPESLGGVAEKLPPDVQASRRAVSSSSRFFAALRQESAAFEVSMAQADDAKVPGDLPLVIIRPGQATTADAALMKQSARSSLVVTTAGGHFVHVDQPGVVLDAMTDVLETVRRDR